MRIVRTGCLLLALVCILCSCGVSFARDEDGFGYTDEKSGIHYTVLAPSFEAAAVGEEWGVYRDRAHGITRAFHQIPGLDPARFLADLTGTVYCADAVLPNVENWSPVHLLICEEDAVSVEITRLTLAADIALLRDAWCWREETELPLDKAAYTRRLKLLGAQYPSLYYCVTFLYYEDGSGYLYSAADRRAVSLTLAETALLTAPEGR